MEIAALEQHVHTSALSGGTVPFTLRQLEYLVAVAEHGGFSAAARATHVSQPALADQLTKLERALGATLLRRRARAVELTETGSRVVTVARRVLSTAAEMADTAKVGERVRVGAIPTVAPYVLPGLLSRAVSMVPLQASTNELVGMLDDGVCDVAVVAAGTVPDRFVVFDVASDPLWLAVPAAMWPHDRPAVVADLAELDMLLLADGHCLREQTVDVCRAAGVSRFGGPLGAASLEMLTGMVASGLGATLVPSVAVPTLQAFPGVRLVRFASDAGLVRTLQLAVRPDRCGRVDGMAVLDPEFGALLGVLREVVDAASSI